MDAIETRLVGLDDIDDYVALRQEMLADCPWAFSASPDTDKACDRSFLLTVLGDRTRQNAIVGAFDSERRIVGAAGVVRERHPKRRHHALIWGVYVRPKWRGRGVGRAIVTAAVVTACEWSTEGDPLMWVQLAVNERAKGAKRLYESLGFRIWGVEEDAIRIEGVSSTEFHMALAI